MDYSGFVKAIKENDRVETERHVKLISAVLGKFIRVRFDAGYHDTEDVVQSTLYVAVRKIRSGQLKSPDALIYYLFTTAKNEYIKKMDKVREVNYHHLPSRHSGEADQLNRLLRKEQMDILRKCLLELRPDHRQYIEYWFGHPGYDAASVANHFGISLNNAWVLKHRIIDMLRKCHRKKSSE